MTSLAQALTHWLTDSLTHWLTDSLTPALSYHLRSTVGVWIAPLALRALQLLRCQRVQRGQSAWPCHGRKETWMSWVPDTRLVRHVQHGTGYVRIKNAIYYLSTPTARYTTYRRPPHVALKGRQASVPAPLSFRLTVHGSGIFRVKLFVVIWKKCYFLSV